MQYIGASNYFDQTLICDVSGCHYRLKISDLLQYPQTKLGKFAALIDEAGVLDAASNPQQDNAGHSHSTMCFPRSATAFANIALFYSTGEIHVSDSSPTEQFHAELDFWQIDINYVAPCCRAKLHTSPPAPPEVAKHNEVTATFTNSVNTNLNSPMSCCSFRSKLWQLLENSPPSPGGQLATILLLVLLLSYIGLVLSYSFPQLRPPKINGTVADMSNPNITEVREFLERVKIHQLIYDIVIGCFVLHFCLRVYAVPDRTKLLLKPWTIIDLSTLIVIVIFEILAHTRTYMDFHLANICKAATASLRMLQVFQFARRSQAFRVMCSTLLDARADLIFLIELTCVAVLIFGTLMWAVESNDDSSPFQNIPIAMYWCAITLTTIGYGDLVPYTTLGRFVASAAAVLGVIIMSMPISILVTKFTAAYATATRTSSLASMQEHNLNVIPSKDSVYKSNKIKS